VIQVVALATGVAGVVVAPRHVPAWVVATAVAAVAVVTGIVPRSALDDALINLGPPLAFLVLAVPLAVLLDELGFFATVAALVDAGPRLRLALWVLAGLVTVLFNLDAAVVLLTPLYVRIASRHGEDPVLLAFLPALLASLASSVLPVSNLTNLVVARRLDLGTTDFLVHAAPVALAATIVGWRVWSRLAGPAPTLRAAHEPAVPGALAIGVPVVVWLLLGFTVGDQLGVPAWVVAGLALTALVLLTRRLPWQHVPVGAAALALSLGTLALGAAPALGLDRALGVPGAGGEALTFGVAALGANLVNNLPALLVGLPALDLHPGRVWAVLLGVNLGPTLWVTGALSTLLWQATMDRLELPVSNRRYAAVGVRVGLPALAIALVVHLALVAVG
jgi:arsenical pump membrane protein